MLRIRKELDVVRQEMKLCFVLMKFDVLVKEELSLRCISSNCGSLKPGSSRDKIVGSQGDSWVIRGRCQILDAEIHRTAPDC